MEKSPLKIDIEAMHRMWRLTEEMRQSLLWAYGRCWERQAGLVPERGGSPMEALEEEVGWYEAPILGYITNALDAKDARIAELEAERHDFFQSRVHPWLMECFGPMIAGDREERNHRFLEESLELVQACGCTKEEAHQLVDYVFNRSIGEPHQEVGGVMVTLAALCLANNLGMQEAGEDELKRIWKKVPEIRAKQAAKPKYSPLPQEMNR